MRHGSLLRYRMVHLRKPVVQVQRLVVEQLGAQGHP
jgi:hypothetical protein